MSKGKKATIIMLVISALQGMLFHIPVGTLFRLSQGVTHGQIAMMESANAALMLVLIIPMGLLTDKIGTRRSWICASAMYFFAKLVLLFAVSWQAFMAERLISAVSAAMMISSKSAYLFEISKDYGSTRAFSHFVAFGSMGGVVAAGLSSVLAGASMRLLVALSACTSMLAFVLCVFLPRMEEVKGVSRPRLKAVVGALFKQRSFILFLVGIAFIDECSYVIGVILNQDVYLSVGVPVALFGVFTMIMRISSMCSGFSAALSQRLGQNRMLMGFMLLTVVCCLIIGVSSVPALCVAAVVLVRASDMFITPMKMELQNRQVQVAERGTIIAVYSMVSECIAVPVRLIVCGSVNRGVHFMGITAALICGAGVGLVAIWMRVKSKAKT